MNPTRRLVMPLGTAAVFLLFVASLFVVFLSNRFSPTVAAARPATLPPAGGSIAYLGDFALSYRITGSDRGSPPVILLLGGAGESGLGYHDRFRFLEASRRVISYDPRGSGLSEVKPNLSHYTVNALTAELDAVRERLAGADGVVIIARGFGAAVAIHYAREFPERVDRLVLLSPMPPDGIRYGSVLDLLEENFRTLATAGIPPADPQAADVWQDRYTLATDRILGGEPVPASRRDLPRASFGTARALLISLASSRAWHAQELTPLPTPVLTLAGAHDTISDVLPALFPGMATTRTERDTDWLLPVQNRVLAEAVLHFLSASA